MIAKNVCRITGNGPTGTGGFAKYELTTLLSLTASLSTVSRLEPSIAPQAVQESPFF